MVQLRLYNSLSRQKEDFIPLDPAHVRLYACGPTVYDYAHIGNARSAVVYDLLARLLRHLFPRVHYVSNITDIEDKIIEAAHREGEAIDTITIKYAQVFNEDMAALGVHKPDVQPLATEHVEDMVALIGVLIQRGLAYEQQGHVLFNVPGFQDYGKLSGRSRDEQVAGARVEIAPYKKDPADFVLWKPSTKDQPGWQSPWGRGRPGWHIECSAMAEAHLGLPFDIHGGGADLKFPHHENEIAQSCGAHDLPPEDFARYWVHNGFLTVEGEKMSKSLGNILLVHDLIQQYSGEVLRLTLLSAQYRQPLDWTLEAIHQAKRLLERMYHVLYENPDAETLHIPDEVLVPLCDDLNTPGVMAALNNLMKQETDTTILAGQLKAAGNLLGVLQKDPAIWLGYGQAGQEMNIGQIEALVEERQVARQNKNFSRADEIRGLLSVEGITIEDTPNGPKWRKSS